MNPDRPKPALNPPAEEAATPTCPHFGPCGGCQLQNLTYTTQLTLKADHLSTLLAPLKLTLPEIQTHSSPPFAYRNRIRLTLATVDGQLRAGYIRNPPTDSVISTEGGASAAVVERPPHLHSVAIKSDRSFLPITQCPIATPILWRAAAAFLALANAHHAAWLNTADQLELFTAANESRLQLTLYLRANPKRLPANLASTFSAFCEQLRTRIPELTGAGIALLPITQDRSRRAEAAKSGPAWGAPGMLYGDVTTGEIATEYWVPRGAFFQVNRFLVETLASIVTGNSEARRGTLAWDLYAGIGLFARPLAHQFDKVVAVEIAEPAATALAAGSKTGKLPNLRAVKSTTLDFLRAAVLQRDRPDLIVLDPPRTGAGPEICALLARIAAPALIYVSCSPETLPRDLEVLTTSGYTISELHLLDLFPQTTHIETVAILTR